LENLKGRKYTENIGVDVMIILKRILGNIFGGFGLDTYGSGNELVSDPCIHKRKKFLDHLIV
jgi:hypothetical protein